MSLFNVPSGPIACNSVVDSHVPKSSSRTMAMKALTSNSLFVCPYRIKLASTKLNGLRKIESVPKPKLAHAASHRLIENT